MANIAIKQNKDVFLQNVIELDRRGISRDIITLGVYTAFIMFGLDDSIPLMMKIIKEYYENKNKNILN